MIRFFVCASLFNIVVIILGTAAGLEFWELACIFWDDIPAEKE